MPQRRFSGQTAPSRRPLAAGGPFRDAWQLSYARCLATMWFLEDQGIGPERMRLSQGGVHEPLQSESGLDKLAEQERVEVSLLNELAVGDRGRSPDHVQLPSAVKEPAHDAYQASSGGLAL